jgi:hypothetical protein
MRSDWRREFKQLGVDQVRARVTASVWSEEKLQAARRWLWRQDHWMQMAALVVGTVVAIAGIVAKFVVDGVK